MKSNPSPERWASTEGRFRVQRSGAVVFCPAYLARAMDARNEAAKLDFRFASTEDSAEIVELVSQQ